MYSWTSTFSPLLFNGRFNIKFDTVKLGWSIEYIEGQRLYFPNIVYLPSLKIDFVLKNSADPDEIPHYVAFHLDLHCLPNKYPIMDKG